MTAKTHGIFHRLSGEGRKVLMVSGLNGQARFWDGVNTTLSAQFSLLVFDQKGCGATPDDGAEWTIETLAADAFAVAQSVFGDEPFAVVGHSTGGAIAQHMAAAHPQQVDSVVLSGTWMRADDYMRAVLDLRHELLTRAPDLDPVLGNLLRVPLDDFKPPVPAVALDPSVTLRRINALKGHDGTPLMERIKQPVMVIGAQDDRIVPIHLARELHERLAGSTLTVLPDGGHFFPQTRATDFAQKITDWLSR